MWLLSLLVLLVVALCGIYVWKRDYINYEYPLIKYFVETYCSNIGIQVGYIVYTLSYQIQVDKPVLFPIFDIIIIKYRDNYLNCLQLLRLELVTVPLSYLSPEYRMQYIVDGKVTDIPYYPGSPFKVDIGELVFYKVKHAYFGKRLEEVARSTYWPITADELKKNTLEPDSSDIPNPHYTSESEL